MTVESKLEFVTRVTLLFEELLLEHLGGYEGDKEVLLGHYQITDIYGGVASIRGFLEPMAIKLAKKLGSKKIVAGVGDVMGNVYVTDKGVRGICFYDKNAGSARFTFDCYAQEP